MPKISAGGGSSGAATNSGSRTSLRDIDEPPRGFSSASSSIPDRPREVRHLSRSRPASTLAGISVRSLACPPLQFQRRRLGRLACSAHVCHTTSPVVGDNRKKCPADGVVRPPEPRTGLALTSSALWPRHTQAPKGFSIADYLPQLGGLTSPSESAKESREAAPSAPAAAWCAPAALLCVAELAASFCTVHNGAV